MPVAFLSLAQAPTFGFAFLVATSHVICFSVSSPNPPRRSALRNIRQDPRVSRSVRTRERVASRTPLRTHDLLPALAKSASARFHSRSGRNRQTQAVCARRAQQRPAYRAELCPRLER